MNKNIIILGAAFLVLWGVANSSQTNSGVKPYPKAPIDCPDGKCPIKRLGCACDDCPHEKETFLVMETYHEAMNGCLGDGKPCLVFIGGIKANLVEGFHHTRVDSLFGDSTPRVGLVVSEPGDAWPRIVMCWSFTPTDEQVRQGVRQYGTGKSAAIRPVSRNDCSCGCR